MPTLVARVAGSEPEPTCVISSTRWVQTILAVIRSGWPAADFLKIRLREDRLLAVPDDAGLLASALGPGRLIPASTCGEIAAVIARHDLSVPPALILVLQAGAAGGGVEIC